MKYYFSILLAITITLASCSSDDDANSSILSELTNLEGTPGSTYDESLAQWTSLKNDNGRSYIYQTDVSSWTGYGAVTEIKVINNIVVSRVYQSYMMDGGTGEITFTESYTENEATLGSHQEGASPVTIDDLYNSCLSEYLTVDEENNTVYFNTETNGLLTLCGFVPDFCADDCFTGISITAFNWIN